MNVDRIVKLVVVVAIVFVGWKYVVPWIKEQGSSGKTTTASSDNSCVRGAERASEAWGSGLSQFVNPPYDLNAWSTFRGNVESRIGAAESACGCTAESCAKAKEAMRELRSLVADLDSTIRNGSDPSGFVERQGAIDDRINEAAELAGAGK
ncbi:MAG TPA: hypothetical protein VGQ36_04590 [Thermoanaerobaculia bacterium]|jgi:hypothetical protein|nr:hypothetical protein [Thermoanaerobaculia bacterium]